MSGSANPISGRGPFGLLVNLSAVIGLIALANAAAARLIGQPVVYCLVASSALAREALGFIQLALLLLVPLGVIAMLRGDKSGLNHLGLAVLIAMLPTMLDTLFNLAPGCAPAQSLKGLTHD